MANPRRCSLQQTESLFAENHELFFNGIGQDRTFCNVRVTSALPPIVLQNSFLGCVQNFPGALVRPPKNYVGGDMINPIFNRRPS